MNQQIIGDLRAELKENASEAALKTGQTFFKEEIRSYGVKTPIVNQISKVFFEGLKNESKEKVFLLCDQLWVSGYLEESLVACNWSYRMKKHYEREDFEVFERWVKHVNNWASCDTLCNHTIGTLVERFPELTERLKQWAGSENRWERRAAAVTLIVPARRGLFLENIFEIATILLEDKDDLVQKGYGWLLKTAGEAHEQPVFDFVIKHRAAMPRTALRYAIEKMPPELKKKAMEKPGK